jgi:SNF family Na+-dependent transporter
MSKDETNEQRVNRELIEFLNELRVALPGVQVLFAFLLTVPFTQRFERLASADRRVYFGAVICAALSSALLIAPAAHHRTRFRSGNKEQILKIGSVLATLGNLFLALGMGAAVHVITRLVYGVGPANVIATSLTVAILVLWFVVPLFYRSNDER